jgi:hypothetical protein
VGEPPFRTTSQPYNVLSRKAGSNLLARKGKPWASGYRGTPTEVNPAKGAWSGFVIPQRSVMVSLDGEEVDGVSLLEERQMLPDSSRSR